MASKKKEKQRKDVKSSNKKNSTESKSSSSVIMKYMFMCVCLILGICSMYKIFPAETEQMMNLSFLSQTFLDDSEPNIVIDQQTHKLSAQRTEKTIMKVEKMLRVKELGDPFAHLSITIHHNGYADPCGEIPATNNTLLEAIYNSISSGQVALSVKPGSKKFNFDAILTSSLNSILGSNQCGSLDKNKSKLLKKYGKQHQKYSNSLLSFCDMGKDNTPVQLDHDSLVPLKTGNEEVFPCHFHTREGLRITSMDQMAQVAREASRNNGCSADENEPGICSGTESDLGLHLYAVPAGRVFMFAPSFIGEVFELPHATVDLDHPVSLEVLSMSPRVFDIKNFFTLEEASSIVTKALNEKSESHRIKASSTGASGYNLNSKRTSENGFDTHGKEATAVKRRCFNVLGFDEYIENLADGLQVLRYNKTKAYIPHLDWIEDPNRQEEHNFDSAGVGSNRFATILLYFNDLMDDAGGETVFTKAWPTSQLESEHVPINEALKNVRSEGIVADFKKNSWEERMVAECRTRLSVKPMSAKAVLFYSQHPDGEPDQNSLHGGCPVLKGSKWAANLWVWNAPRSGYPGAPQNMDVVLRNRKNNKEQDVPDSMKPLVVSFENSGTDPTYDNAELYFQETFWSKLGKNDPPSRVNTFPGHEWNLYVDGKRLKQWIIDGNQKYVVHKI